MDSGNGLRKGPPRQASSGQQSIEVGECLTN
jgi:hypothetical protein